MNPNDRFALELGRALVRALLAEGERDQAKAELEALKASVPASEPPSPPAAA